MDFSRDVSTESEENNASDSGEDVSDDDRSNEDDDDARGSPKVTVQGLPGAATHTAHSIWPLPSTSTASVFLPRSAADHGARVVELESGCTREQSLHDQPHKLFPYDVQSHIADDVCEIISETGNADPISAKVGHRSTQNVRTFAYKIAKKQVLDLGLGISQGLA